MAPGVDSPQMVPSADTPAAPMEQMPPNTLNNASSPPEWKNLPKSIYA